MSSPIKRQFALLAFEKVAAAVAASFIPGAVYWLAHVESILPDLASWEQGIIWSLVVGGLSYSAPSVARWAEGFSRSIAKAIGFTVLLEGVLVFSKTQWLSLLALAILAGINCLVATSAMRNRAKAFSVPAKRTIKRKAKASLVPA